MRLSDFLPSKRAAREADLDAEQYRLGWLAGRDTAIPYPHDDGDCVVLGPEVIIDKSSRVIGYKGENFYSDATVTESLGMLSADLAGKSGAWDGKAPDWFPEPPQWLELWRKCLAAVFEGRRDEPCNCDGGSSPCSHCRARHAQVQRDADRLLGPRTDTAVGDGVPSGDSARLSRSTISAAEIAAGGITTDFDPEEPGGPASRAEHNHPGYP